MLLVTTKLKPLSMQFTPLEQSWHCEAAGSNVAGLEAYQFDVATGSMALYPPSPPRTFPQLQIRRCLAGCGGAVVLRPAEQCVHIGGML